MSTSDQSTSDTDTNTAPQQPDVEIYVMKQTLNTITGWLEAQFDHCSEIETRGRSHTLTVTLGEHQIPVNIVENASGKAWTSIWFDSQNTAWSNDAECGRSAHAALNARVRCNASFWKEEAGNMDEWLEISMEGEESLIDWPS